jgi:hypothetical protein
MNRKVIVAFKIFALCAVLSLCTGSRAQVVPPKPTQIPDLIISSLTAKFIAPNKVHYSWTITNIGTGPVNLDGPTAANSDNLSVQAMVSKDTVFGNAGDVPAGGTIIGVSPLGNLAPGASRNGSFTATVQANLTQLPHLVLKVDPSNAVAELNENNNTAAVGIGR